MLASLLCLVRFFQNMIYIFNVFLFSYYLSLYNFLAGFGFQPCINQSFSFRCRSINDFANRSVFLSSVWGACFFCMLFFLELLDFFSIHPQSDLSLYSTVWGQHSFFLRINACRSLHLHIYHCLNLFLLFGLSLIF